MPQKLLIVRFSSIGDIVLTTPVIRCLKKQLDVELHFLTKAQFATILNENPYLTKVYSIKKDLSEVIKELKAENYDEIIDLHNNLRTLMLRLKLGVKRQVFPKLNFRKFLLTQFGINRMPDVHIVDRYLKTVKHLNVSNDGAGLDYFIPQLEEVNTQSEIGVLSGNYIALVIGAAHGTKRLPQNKLISLCKKVKQKIVLVGGPDDRDRGEEVLLKTGGHVVNSCGRFSLHQSASVIRQAGLVITHDTGMMHIAAAFQKKIISVWGNTVPEFGMFPYVKSENDFQVQVKGLSCRPCSKIGFEKCPKAHFKCMEDIDENIILQQLQQY